MVDELHGLGEAESRWRELGGIADLGCCELGVLGSECRSFGARHARRKPGG